MVTLFRSVQWPESEGAHQFQALIGGIVVQWFQFPFMQSGNRFNCAVDWCPVSVYNEMHAVEVTHGLSLAAGQLLEFCACMYGVACECEFCSKRRGNPLEVRPVHGEDLVREQASVGCTCDADCCCEVCRLRRQLQHWQEVEKTRTLTVTEKRQRRKQRLEFHKRN